MRNNPQQRLSVEQLGGALDLLGFHPTASSKRALNRAEMLGILKFIVDAELHEAQDDVPFGGEVQHGYGIGAFARTAPGARSTQEHAQRQLELMVNLVAYNVAQAGSQVHTLVELADPTYGLAKVCAPLTNGLSLLLLAAERMPREGEAAEPGNIRRAVAAARPHLREARQALEGVRAQVRD